ncbi:hypothetical protein GH714_009277 [Hevea brasiliensis]|uniref:VAN3-binding protein-like auxin canalisation domain-containing protein n=1 Tax=Hevea brasiliensis TaxID=3981 RepID=A0A6A6ML67_HEVBR|nr:hypothetical protein GH714_009277 [Hevea brasiliensis]
MEFLSRSWSLSASEISKALAQKQRQFFTDNQPSMFPADTVAAPQLTRKIINSLNSRKTGSIGKWFHHKELSSSTVKKKEGTHGKCARCFMGVCDETTAWPYRKERENSEEVYFGLKTAQGLLEFSARARSISKDGLIGFKIFFIKSTVLKKLNVLWNF